MGQEEKRMK